MFHQQPEMGATKRFGSVTRNIQILFSSTNTHKKNLGSICFLIFFWLFLLFSRFLMYNFFKRSQHPAAKDYAKTCRLDASHGQWELYTIPQPPTHRKRTLGNILPSLTRGLITRAIGFITPICGSQVSKMGPPLPRKSKD